MWWDGSSNPVCVTIGTVSPVEERKITSNGDDGEKNSKKNFTDATLFELRRGRQIRFGQKGRPLGSRQHSRKLKLGVLTESSGQFQEQDEVPLDLGLRYVVESSGRGWAGQEGLVQESLVLCGW